MLFKKRRSKDIVLGIDGVPYSFLRDGIDRGDFPGIERICNEGSGLNRHNSVIPTVSSVAWTSYMTGKNPGEHSIYGFVDRNLNPFNLKIPLGGDRTAATLWKKMSDKGKKVLVLNVPLTYPPEDLNGILISGFLTPGIEKSARHSSVIDFLKSKGYVIDVDPRLGHTDRARFMSELHRALDIRMETFHELLEKDKYDFAQCHIMETDRINHFFWGDYEDGVEFKEEFHSFYKKLDDWIVKTYNLLDSDDRFMVLSDHGFCRVKYNVQLNHFLEEEGYLSYSSDNPENVTDLSGDSKAYSLIPGRVFINRKNREERGSVDEDEYEDLREELKIKLTEIKDPEGESIVEDVFYREEIYSGPFLSNAADIIVNPKWGYDLKGHIRTGKLYHKPEAIDGMHTFNDATIFGINIDITGVESIQDPLKNLIEH